MGLLGLGDQTTPLANMAEAAQGVWQAGKNTGVLSSEMGGAVLTLGGTMIPGGRQLQKTVQGVQTLADGGRVYGYGDNARLQYPVERTPIKAAQAVLFGNSGLSETRDFYANRGTGLTAKQTTLLKDMVKAGADRQTVFDAIQSVRAAEGAGEKMQALDGAGLSDQERLRLYTGVVAGSNSSKPETFRRLMADGMSWAQVSSAYQLYLELEGAESLSDTVKAARFSKWAEQAELSPEQRMAVQKVFPAYAQAGAEVREYAAFVENGFDPDTAEGLALQIGALMPEAGRETVSDLQRYRAVAGYGLPQEQQLAALEMMMPDTEYEKLETACQSGVKPGEYITFKESTAGLTADKGSDGKSISGSKKKKVLDAINAMDLTEEQKTELYYAAGYKGSTLYEDAPWYNIRPRLTGGSASRGSTGRSGTVSTDTAAYDIRPKLIGGTTLGQYGLGGYGLK